MDTFIERLEGAMCGWIEEWTDTEVNSTIVGQSDIDSYE
jgi:hypothetical protein